MQNSVSSTSDTPEKTEKQRILGLIVRGLFNRSWDPKDPDSSPEARKAAFDKARPELRRTAIKLHRFLENNGVEVTLGKPVDKLKNAKRI